MSKQYKQVGDLLVEMSVSEIQEIEDNNVAGILSGSTMRRDGLLNDTDWWAVSDRTMSEEQTLYRQALRDITTHGDWPNIAEEDWPTKP
tara:strand:- start:37 stop:303 length:267 start_codon:yes stop_codon:yes gene_type:complete